ncbi:MAG TPA: DUF488 domain-containing protein [Flavobacteriaceae bacterium]|nr:DUF488 domain-containing protein [Flavobacteriaceae bacterium]
MSDAKSFTLFTIGHSTRDIKSFIELLLQNKIAVLVDVRRFPVSKKFPHFNKERLAQSLKDRKIEYLHCEALGGRRKPRENSNNLIWRNKSFQAYADYMETEDFKIAIAKLTSIAEHKTTAIMCSEAVWWRCHRALISDYLKVKGWTVIHIISKTNLPEHPFTSAAKIIDNKLTYSK